MRVLHLIDNLMSRSLDSLALFLWNQFGIEHIWWSRVTYLIIVGTELYQYGKKTVSPFQLTVSLIVFTAIVLVNEVKWPTTSKATWNGKVILLRSISVALWLRSFILLLGIVLIFLGGLQDGPLESISYVSWILFLFWDYVLLSEEPRKPWKLKLPSLSLNTPLPQGT